MVKHNTKNIEELVKAVVEDWDMDTLVSYAREKLVEYFKKDKTEFQDAWEDKFGEEK